MAKEKENSNTSQTNSIVGPNSVVQGNLEVKGSALIYGTVIGDIHAEGLVRSSQDSLIKGSVYAAEAVIDGSLEGSLHVKGRATLGTTARMVGEVKVDMLVIEEGAQFSGKCKMKGAKIQGNGALSSTGTDSHKSGSKEDSGKSDD
jgi:cytoskeletal protein CcmA (bactofilin family)